MFGVPRVCRRMIGYRPQLRPAPPSATTAHGQRLEPKPVHLYPDIGSRPPHRIPTDVLSSPYGRSVRISRPCHAACFSA